MLIVHHLPKKNPTEKGSTLEIKKRWTPVKGKFPAIIRKKFLPESKLHRDMNTKINYEAQKEYETLKREHLSRMKDDLDFKGCTFNPKFNMTSMNLVTKSERVPVQGRGCPDRYNREFLETQKDIRNKTLEENELATLKIPVSERKTPDPQFFEQKVKWKKEIQEQAEAEAKRRFEEECATFIGKPEVIDYSKNKIVNAESLDNGPFLERVDKDIEQRKERIQVLDKKYYNFPHTPTLYKPERKKLKQ